MNKNILLIAITAFLTGTAFAKLPSPVLTDEAKAKAAEATAKTAHGNKIADFQLCKSREATAAYYYKSAKATGKETKPATDTPACADPGAFVFPLPAAPTAVAPAPSTTAAAKPAAVPTVPVKK